MGFIGDIMRAPLEMAESLFVKGYFPFIIIGLVIGIIYFIFFR